jgi:probable F420-dependent oxidoreductase
MRFGIALPNYGPSSQPEILVRLARQAEELNVDSIWVSDHLVAPVGVQSIYPYDRRPDARPGDMGVIERFCEPLITLAYLAGHTRRIRLGVSAYIMPYRNPVLTAKHVATLDTLSGGRLLLGIGTGWLREEFHALGVPFTHRGRRTDEYLDVCKALWSGDEVQFDGRHYRLPRVRTGPRPAQHPHPPLWIAGNSRAAIERAARCGDGWHAIDLAPAEITPLIGFLRERVGAYGRAAAEVTVSLRKGVLVRDEPPAVARPLYGDRATIRHDLEAYRAAGVDYLVVNLRQARSGDELVQAMDDVVAALSA